MSVIVPGRRRPLRNGAQPAATTRMSARPWVASLLAVLSLPACLAPPALPPLPDAGAPRDGASAQLTLLSLRIEDARGIEWPVTAAPRMPIVRLEFSSPPFASDAVLLVSGEPDLDLLDDLDEAPLRAATTDRAIAVEATLRGPVLTLAPREPLAAGSVVTIAIPRFLEDARGARLTEARAEPVRISGAASAGARATDSWPPDGAFDVAPSLALAAMRFDGTLDQASRAIVLTDVAGHAVAASAEAAPCAMVGWAAGTCVTLIPTGPLAPSSTYLLGIADGARDGTGAALPPFSARFATAASDPAPIAVVNSPCGLGETSIDDVCARADDESITVHAQLSSAARVRWRLDERTGELVTPRGALSLRIDPLASERDVVLDLDAIDYAGRTTTLALPLRTTEPLPRLTITEIRSDPAGTEPRQEYVEIANEGPVPVSLAGMTIADAVSAAGDALPAIVLPSGARALLVGSGFDPDDDASGRDAPVPPGALLVRLDASIGSGGLSNAGEPLFLRDELGRWISAAPATPVPRSGVCVVRVAQSLRTGEPGSFEYDADGTCTPGR